MNTLKAALWIGSKYNQQRNISMKYTTKPLITTLLAAAAALIAHVAMAEDANAGNPQKRFKGPVKVFILAGQSNMEGQGSVDH